MKWSDVRRWYPAVGITGILGLYATSFFLPALSIPLSTDRLFDRLESEIGDSVGGATIDRNSMRVPRSMHLSGYDCFRHAMSLGPYGTTLLAWCTNPAIWTGLVLLAVGRAGPALLAGILASGLAVFAGFVLPHIGRSGADIYWSWYDYRLGYWVWLSSAVALAAISCAVQRTRSSRIPSPAGSEQPYPPQPAAAPVSQGTSPLPLE